MTGTAAAPIEDFLEAITAQLDKTQDALRLKAVNRPLTFALKDFSIDLSVFVEMDRDGMVRLRPSGPNESGASTISIGFTTITRPMIEENTISLETAQSPTLEEAGLAPDESLRLQRLGVRNTAQLDRLSRQSGEDGVARFSGVDAGRLKQAMQLTRPRIDYVDIGAGRRAEVTPGPERAQVPIRQGQQRLRLRGAGLTDEGAPSRARLGGRHLPIRAASFSHLDLDLPEGADQGAELEIEFPNGESQILQLVPDAHEGTDPGAASWSTKASEEGTP